MNNKKIFIAISLIALGLLVAGFKGCPSPLKSDLQKGLETAKQFGGGVAISTKEKQETKAGITTYGSIHLGDAQLAAIDQGFASRAALAVADGHTQALDPHFYDVYTPPYQCPLSPEQKIPSFLIRGDNPWDGSEYDQWNTKGKLSTPFRENGILYTYVRDNVGIVFAAEYVINLGTEGSNINRGQMYVCPNLTPVLPEAVGNGFDHIVLANNGQTYSDGFHYFWCSQYHGLDSLGHDLSHPLLPRGERCYDPSLAKTVAGNPPVINYTLAPVDPGSVPRFAAGPNNFVIRDVDWRRLRPVK